MIFVIDLDGTLVNSFERHYVLLNRLLEKYTKKSIKNKNEYFKFKKEGYNNRKYLEEKLNVDSEISQVIQKEWIENIEGNSMLKLDTLYDDAISFLTKLREFANIYFLTARENKKGVTDFINKSNLNKYCEECFVVSTNNARKNKAEKIEELKRKNLGKEIIIIGDTEVDFYSASNMNCKSYILNRGFRSRNFLKNLGIYSYSDLEEIIERIRIMKNCKLIDFNVIKDKRGKMIPIEYPKQLEFPLKRIYYIYDVAEGERRGYHSHNDLEQVLIAVSGEVKILVKTPYEEKIIKLDNPSQGLYIGPMIWREMFDFSKDAVLLVLASHEYDESDYIRNYNDYEEKAKVYFRR